jgi:hypothetical protein
LEAVLKADFMAFALLATVGTHNCASSVEIIRVITVVHPSLVIESLTLLLLIFHMHMT